MNKLIATILLTLALVFSPAFESTANASTRVGGYYRSSGKYVAPHYRSDSNHVKYDNWSTKGNSNPYTGKKGFKKW